MPPIIAELRKNLLTNYILNLRSAIIISKGFNFRERIMAYYIDYLKGLMSYKFENVQFNYKSYSIFFNWLGSSSGYLE